MLTCAISKELWMQLWLPFLIFGGYPFMKSSLGSLRVGNALGDGQDRLFVILNCILSTGVPLFLYLARNYLLDVFLVFPFTSETNLLFTNSSGDRESTHGTEKTNGIPYIMCRNWGTESYGEELHGFRTDKSEELMHQSRGSNHSCRSILTD